MFIVTYFTWIFYILTLSVSILVGDWFWGICSSNIFIMDFILLKDHLMGFLDVAFLPYRASFIPHLRNIVVEVRTWGHHMP